MGNDLLTFVRQQGLPGWIVLVIGSGTIIAALISFIGAFAIAWVNARAAVRLDQEKAFRDHRRANVEPVRGYVRDSGTLIGRARIELSRADDLQKFSEQALNFIRTLDASGKELGALHIDGSEVRRAIEMYFKSGRLLCLEIVNILRADRIQFRELEPYFELVMSNAGAAMDATDAYVFPTRKLTRSAKQRLDLCIDKFGKLKANTSGATDHPELA